MQYLLVGLLAVGCAEPEDPIYGEVQSEVNVSAYVTSGCSTSVVVGLSKQIAEEIGCMNPTSLVKFAPGGNLTFTSTAVLPYMSAAAKTALGKVTQNYTIQVNSGFRTVAQQYLLYRWYQQGRCGISAAASPGRSNHQSGRALDIANYSSRVSAMANQGWSHSVPGDPVHFDYLSSPDIRGKDVLAFQRLWNRNNPNDRIAEDGAYGPQTEARLKSSPATGFALGPTCGAQAAPEPQQPGEPRVLGAEVVSVDGPDKVAPGTHGVFSLVVQNTGNVPIPMGTRVMVMNGGTSELHDPSSWTSPTEVGPIAEAIPVGALGNVDIEFEAPMVTEETPVFTQFVLTDGQDQYGVLDIAVRITPNGDEGTSGESDDIHDEAPEVQGGCSTSGGSPSWAALMLPAIALLLRRRRR
ncbi:MAG: M15 family metallopeptidase [Kofleriaceae bacterium]